MVEVVTVWIDFNDMDEEGRVLTLRRVLGLPPR